VFLCWGVVKYILTRREGLKVSRWITHRGGLSDSVLPGKKSRKHVIGCTSASRNITTAGLVLAIDFLPLNTISYVDTLPKCRVYQRIGQYASPPPFIAHPYNECQWRGYRGLPIRDDAASHNNLVPRFPKLSITDVTIKTIFERLYLVPGLTPIFTLSQLFLCTHIPTAQSPAISRFFWSTRFSK